jgi:hypothetical protein
VGKLKIIALLVLALFASPAAAWKKGLAVGGVNACGPSNTNNWCFMANGWTKVTAKTRTTGTCSNSSGTSDGTCIVAVDRNVAASFTASTATNQLTILSGTPPTAGQTLVMTGVAAGTTISGASSPFTLSTSPGTIGSTAAYSIAGNDTTCASQIATTNYTTEDLSSFSPTAPCATLATAQGKTRLVSADWVVMKLGGADYGALNGTNGNLANKSGTSTVYPWVFTTYGTGAKAQMVRTDRTVDGLIKLQGIAGNNTVWLLGDVKLYDAVTDPNSVYYSGGAVVGDTGTGNGCATNTEICNIVSIPSKIAAGSIQAVYGTGVEGGIITSVGASNIVFSGTTVPSAARGVGVTYQINDRSAGQAGFSSNVAADLLIVEGGEFYYSNITQAVSNTISSTPNIFVRRNTISYSATLANGACIFTDVNYLDGTNFLFEENVCNWGGFYPFRWAQGKRTGTHGLYLHNPSTGQNLTRNIIANSSSTGVQFRDAMTSYNNIMANNAVNVSTNVTVHNFSSSYDVYTNAVPGNFGYRTAICAGTCTSGTTLSMEGILVSPSADCNPCTIKNLSNPGSIVGAINVSSGILTATSATLTGTGAGLFAGKRGDGVKTGDTLQFMTTASQGVYVARNQQFISAGPAGGTLSQYLGPTTVSVTAASPAVVTETGGATFIRVPDEPFQFSAGTLPTGLSLATDYCSASTITTNSYEIYLPTAGVCSGGASINTTGSNQTGITRTGTRKWLFTVQAPPSAALPVPYTGVQSWVTPGMAITTGGIAGQCGGSAPTWTGSTSTVSSITASAGIARGAMISADPSLVSISGKDNVQESFNFGGVSEPNAPTIRVGPNNIFTNVVNTTGATGNPGTFFAITASPCAWGINAAGNWIHNWNPTNITYNTYDISGGNATSVTNSAAYLASNSFSSYSLNDIDYTTRLETLLEAYDAEIVRGTTFTGTIAPNGSGGSIVTITGGTPPVAGDTLFDASGSNPLGWYVQIPPAQTIGSTFFIDQVFTKGTPFAMRSGSVDHFMACALNQSKRTGWNYTCGANAANNYIRAKMDASIPQQPQQWN